MPTHKSAEALQITVRAVMSRAAEAVHEQDIDGMADGLAVAIGVYEQHPSQVHEPLSQLRDLLLWIRAGRSLCATVGRPDSDFAALELRAEALRQPLQ